MISVGDLYLIASQDDNNPFMKEVRGAIVRITHADAVEVYYLHTNGLDGSWTIRAEFERRIGLWCHKTDATIKPSAMQQNVDDERVRQMKFFFGCKPSDPTKLPPLPLPAASWPDADDY